MNTNSNWHGTTIVLIRKGKDVVVAGDGQVSLGNTVIKSTAKKVRKITNIQLSISGGAGSLDDIKVLIKECGVVGAIAGSLFVFKGRFKAVLINYPSSADKKKLLRD